MRLPAAQVLLHGREPPSSSMAQRRHGIRRPAGRTRVGVAGGGGGHAADGRTHGQPLSRMRGQPLARTGGQPLARTRTLRRQAWHASRLGVARPVATVTSDGEDTRAAYGEGVTSGDGGRAACGEGDGRGRGRTGSLPMARTRGARRRELHLPRPEPDHARHAQAGHQRHLWMLHLILLPLRPS